MSTFWIKIPSFIQYLFPNYSWKIKNTEQKIFLTFDDGPIPQVTEWVLDILKKENIKATFFCIGDNIKKNPQIFKRIAQENHSIGNHTFNHLKGWKTNTKDYLENFNLCKIEIESFDLANHKLFRPPYGKIKKQQAKRIKAEGYQIIMWDVLSYDFDQNITPENCLKNVVKNTTTGSIIVFHDSLKAKKNLEYALPKAIQELKEKGFVFETIT
ncbi:polysaccharide deacetylase family protein [Flavobacterium jejuense]|uniref:Polysaccharide deacetylase family protein n=1 Tax=Flavobacterium jejuense TaxID=1544455 RepID=A0ABX0IU72_9FLAO|nr:polysaccharide deacetylase family protein [Flavobacterium jejuense]NHN27455.1 polysaccharide deacetylase family protein [Flavobacterium jejuense]